MLNALFSLSFMGRLGFAGTPGTSGHRPAFEVGEKLTYSLGWQFDVGSVITGPMTDGKRCKVAFGSFKAELENN